jgi:two-component system chemotaxis response regulator CheB
MPTSAIANVDIDYIAQLDEIATLINTITKEEAPIMDPNSGNSNGNNGDLRNDLFSLTDEARPVNEEELPGDPSFYTCPECHGTLWQVSEGDLLRFRCRVGHAYSAQTLSSSQGDALEAALYAAMRALEEARSLRTRMAQRARSRGLTQMAENFMAQSQEAEERANTIRAILIQTAPNPEHSLATIGESD